MASRSHRRIKVASTHPYTRLIFAIDEYTQHSSRQFQKTKNKPNKCNKKQTTGNFAPTGVLISSKQPKTDKDRQTKKKTLTNTMTKTIDKTKKKIVLFWTHRSLDILNTSATLSCPLCFSCMVEPLHLKKAR